MIISMGSPSVGLSRSPRTGSNIY